MIGDGVIGFVCRFGRFLQQPCVYNRAWRLCTSLWEKITKNNSAFEAASSSTAVFVHRHLHGPLHGKAGHRMLVPTSIRLAHAVALCVNTAAIDCHAIQQATLGDGCTFYGYARAAGVGGCPRAGGAKWTQS